MRDIANALKDLEEEGNGVPSTPPSPLAKKATRRKGNGKKEKGTAAPMSRMGKKGKVTAAPMIRMENGDTARTGHTGRTRKPSQKLIEAAEAAAQAAEEKAAKAVAKAEAAKARAAKAAAAAAIVAQEGYRNDFAKMLRQSELEGPQFSMGLPINLPKLPRRGGKRRTVRRRR